MTRYNPLPPMLTMVQIAYMWKINQPALMEENLAPESERQEGESPKPRQNPDEPEKESSEPKPSLNQDEILRVLDIVERDSVAIAESYTSLFSSLCLGLSEVTTSSVEHMYCFNDAARSIQDSVLDAATKGNRYLNSCLRLNEEMKGIESLAIQLKILRRNVDALDSAVNKLVRLP